MTIRLRLTLWYTALLGATLIFFSVIVYSALAMNLQAQVLQDSQREAVSVANAVSLQIERDLRKLPEGESIEFPSLNYFASSVAVQVINRDGLVVKQSDNLANMTVPGYTSALPSIEQGLTYRYRTVLGEQPLLVYSVPLFIGGQVLGAVQIVHPIGAAEDALAQVGRYLIIGTALSLIVAAVVGALLAVAAARRPWPRLHARQAALAAPRTWTCASTLRTPIPKSASWPSTFN